MIYILALLPATALTVAGYVVLYVAGRSEGTFRAFGRYLGFWAFTLAGLVILGAIFAAAHGGRGMMGHMRGGGPGEGCWGPHPPMPMDCFRCPMAPNGPDGGGSGPGAQTAPPKASAPAPQ